MSVAILGAGISGLTVARALREKGIEVTVLEASDQPGGLCRTSIVDGYTFDHSGGHIVFSKSAEAMNYYFRLFADQPMVKSERQTRILFKGRYIPYPFENGIGQLPATDRLHCLKGVIESSLARSAGAPKPNNFRDWIRWHIGRGIGELFMEPYNRKIWELDDLAQMGISWVDGRVPEAPISDIVRSALGQSTVGYAHQAIFYYPHSGGFQAITDRIAAHVADRVHYRTPVTDIARKNGKVYVNGQPFDAVVSTIPIPKLAKLVQALDSTTRTAAEGLGWISLACFLFGIAAEDVQPLSWIYLPHPEQGPANRVTYLSNYSPQNAPTGRGSLMAEVTYRGKFDFSKQTLKDVRRVLAQQGLFREENVDVELMQDNPFAYIHYTTDFVAQRKAAIDGLEAYGIEPLGRFGRYNYYNTDLCILEALELAEKLAARLGVAP